MTYAHEDENFTKKTSQSASPTGTLLLLGHQFQDTYKLHHSPLWLLLFIIFKLPPNHDDWCLNEMENVPGSSG